LTFWPALTLGVIVALIALGTVAITTALEDVKTRTNELEDKPLVMHMHVALNIIINDEQVIIPGNVGIDPSLYKTHDLDRYGIKNPKKIYPVHTHDTSGVIHIESTELRTFNLSQFFDVWGQTFNEECIMDKCNNEFNKVTMFIDGVQSSEFGEHVFRNNERITIIYGQVKGQHPL